MDHFAIRFMNPPSPTCCPVCGARQHGKRGPCLFRADHDDPLCRTCGKKLAPTMAALLDLAYTAEKVGRHTRHLLTPPMESLLDLARAAENYSDASPAARARAG